MAILGVVASIAAAPPSRAATVVRLSNAELAKRADVILLGKVVSQTPRAGEGSFIMTEVSMDVTAFVKSGDPTAKTFKFLTVGGTLDGRTFTFSGNTKYTDGEDVLLFLEAPHPKTSCRFTVGLGQGKFNVRVEEGTGKKFLERDLGGLRFVDAHGRVEEPAKPSEPRLYLEPFIQEIKTNIDRK
jgi:hypothetical protein